MICCCPSGAQIKNNLLLPGPMYWLINYLEQVLVQHCYNVFCWCINLILFPEFSDIIHNWFEWILKEVCSIMALAIISVDGNDCL